MILNLYKKYEEIINYLIVGVLTTLVSILSYALLTRVCHIDVNTSTILSWVISVTFAFFTNKLYVFKSKNKKIIDEMFKFYTSRLASLGIEVLIMNLLVFVIHIDDMISKIIVQVIVIILNYILSKIFVFKDNKSH
jgi:putative flippase GtrA